MKFMVAIFLVVTLIIVDQARFRGYYLDRAAYALAWAIR